MRDPFDDERISAHLDGELAPAEESVFGDALRRDPALASAVEELAAVRARLAGAAAVEPRPGALERLVAEAGAADVAEAGAAGVDEALAEGRPLVLAHRRSRRWIPPAAALVAAAAVLVVVVGGLGGSTAVPALDELVARHEAAAAPVTPPDMPMEPMPMDEADTLAPHPDELVMTDAFRDDGLVHLVYRGPDGDVVSVFREDGTLDATELRRRAGEGGTVSSRGGRTIWTDERDDTTVTVVGTGDVTWTVIGVDAEAMTTSDMLDDMADRGPDAWSRVREGAEWLTRPWRLVG